MKIIISTILAIFLLVTIAIVADATVTVAAGAGKGHTPITICHKEKNTITIDNNALPAHLSHGDTLGACNTATPRPTPRVVGSPPSVTIRLPETDTE